MGIEWFRDLVIIILGIIAIVVLILISVLSYLLYQKSRTLMDAMHLVYQRANSILDTIESTSVTMQGIASDIKEVMLNPVTQIIATIQGIRQGIGFVNKFIKKEEDKAK